MRELNYFDKNELLDTFTPTDWQSIIYKEFEATLLSKTRPFPCVFGVAGLQMNELRFGFSERMNGRDIATSLYDYLPRSREFGKNTSLIIFSRPAPVASIDQYRERFWDILSDINQYDTHEWPKDIPRQLDNPGWEWCFGGEPIFVVCNTPAHVNRQSRRSSCFMMTFQPRWVFDGILGSQDKAEASIGKVRKRLKNFDMIPESPDLGLYGDPENREYRQYFLDEENEPAKCPFSQMTRQAKGFAA